MFADVEQSIAELRDAIGVGQPCTIEQDMAELISRDFTPEARLAQARRGHRKRSHLVRFITMRKLQEL